MAALKRDNMHCIVLCLMKKQNLQLRVAYRAILQIQENNFAILLINFPTFTDSGVGEGDGGKHMHSKLFSTEGWA